MSSSLSCYRHADLGGDFSGTSLFLGLQHASDDVRVMSIKQLKEHLQSSPAAELTQDDITVSESLDNGNLIADVFSFLEA